MLKFCVQVYALQSFGATMQPLCQNGTLAGGTDGSGASDQTAAVFIIRWGACSEGIPRPSALGRAYIITFRT